MRKLLLAFAGLSVIGATAQEARIDLGRSAAMYAATHADGTPLNTSYNKQSSAVAIGTAPNVYGAAFGPKTNLVANEDLNTVAFVHRSDYNSNGDNSSGSLRFDYSTDGGATWTSNSGPLWNPVNNGYSYPGVARYPHVGILNETGNVNPLNSSLTLWAPTLAGINPSSSPAWGGALVGTHKLDNSLTNMVVDTTSGHLTLDESFTQGNQFWGISFDQPNYDVEEYTDTVVIWKGDMDFTTDSMALTQIKAHLPVTNDPNSGKIVGDGRISFDENGSTGYISIEAYDSLIAPNKVIHPYMIKTSDGGLTWSQPFGPNLDLLVDQVSGDSLKTLIANESGWSVGSLTSSTRGHDMEVDANGNPHMFVHIFPGVGTTPTGGTTAGDFVYYPFYNRLVDIYTTDGGLTWKCNVISRVYTWEYEFDPTNGPVTEANRPHISMSSDREMMFFSWFESDTSFVTGTENNFPDWRCQGFNVLGDSLEGPMTVMGTFGDATWGNVADYAFDNGDGSYQLHMTYAPIADFGTFSVLSPIDFYYLGAPYPNNIGIEEMEAQNFSVSQNYPNPTNGLTKVAIESVEAAAFTMNIMDITGRTIEVRDLGRLDAGRHIEEIDATGFAPGIYFYTVSSAGHQSTKKFIVE
jgi:hypothetical protein